MVKKRKTVPIAKWAKRYKNQYEAAEKNPHQS